MFRALFIPSICLSAFSLLPAAAQKADLTLDQIVQKHTDALGGIDNLKAIDTVTITGTASLMGGQMGAPVTIRMKRPAFLRMDMHIRREHSYSPLTEARAGPSTRFPVPAPRSA